MFGDYESELRGDTPRREAMTRADLLTLGVLAGIAWCAVIGFIRVVQWMVGINPGVL